MQQFNIKAASRQQIAAIPGIEIAAATLFAEADLPQSLRFKTTAVCDLRYALDHGRLWVAVADNEQVVGYAATDILDAGAHLTEIDVLPAYGKLGIGTRLVNATIEWARNAGFPSLTLITFSHLDWNAPFYAKIGFQLVAAAEYGEDVAGQLKEEQEAGIDVTKRVVMRMSFV